jgi:hypothetical protein
MQFNKTTLSFVKGISSIPVNSEDIHLYIGDDEKFHYVNDFGDVKTLTVEDDISGFLMDYALTSEIVSVSGNLQDQIENNDSDISQLRIDVDAISGGLSSVTIAKSQITDFTESDYVHITGDENVGGNKTFLNDVSVAGTFTIAGSAFQVDTEHVRTSDNIITVNYGEVGTGVTSLSAGIVVDRGSEEDYYFIFNEISDTFRIGEAGSLQAVATRSDSIANNNLVYWDDTENIFKDAGIAYTSIDPISGNYVSKSGGTMSGPLTIEYAHTGDYLSGDAQFTIVDTDTSGYCGMVLDGFYGGDFLVKANGTTIGSFYATSNYVGFYSENCDSYVDLETSSNSGYLANDWNVDTFKVNNNLTVTGNISGGFIYGDGSKLTNIVDDNLYVSKSGDRMTGALTIEDTSTSALVVSGGAVFGDAVTVQNRIVFGDNVIIGDSTTGEDITTATGNFLLGPSAGKSLTTGVNHVAIGNNALLNCLTSAQSIAIGSDALLNAIGSQSTIAIGSNSLKGVTSATETVAIGPASGLNATGTISRSVFIGKDAGRGQDGENKLYIAGGPNGVSGFAETLIYGEFDNKYLEVRGGLAVTNLSGSAGNIITTDNTGKLIDTGYSIADISGGNGLTEGDLSSLTSVISTTENISASAFYGDGFNLTNIENSLVNLRQTYKKIESISDGNDEGLKVLVFGDSVAYREMKYVYERLTDDIGVKGLYLDVLPKSGTYRINNGTTVPYDYTYWPTGITVALSGSETVNFGSGGLATDTYNVYYVTEPGNGTFDIVIGGAFQANIDTDASLGAGVFSTTLGSVATRTTTINNVTGNVRIIGVGIENSQASGVVLQTMNRGGLALSDANTTDINIISTVLTSLNPDLTTFEMIDAVSGFESILDTHISTFSPYISGSDRLFIASSPTQTGDEFNVINNEIIERKCKENGYDFFNSYRVYGGFERLQSLGWGGDGVHLSQEAYDYGGFILWRELGLDDLYINGQYVSKSGDSVTGSLTLLDDLILSNLASISGNIITTDNTGKIIDSGVAISSIGDSISGNYVSKNGDTMNGSLVVNSTVEWDDFKYLDATTGGTSSLYIGVNTGASGSRNVGLGNGALGVATGSNNMAIGSDALSKVTSSNNVGIGFNAGKNTTSGQNVVAIGAQSLLNNVTGRNTIAIGTFAGQNSTSDNNIYIGGQSGQNTTGSGNTFVGYQTGRDVTGNGNVIFGNLSAQTQTSISNKLWIANTATNTPLIYGEFDNELLKINGDLLVSALASISGNIITTDATGKLIDSGVAVSSILALHSSAENTDVDTGTENVDTFSASLGRSCQWLVRIGNGTTFRTSTVMAVWNADSSATVHYTETSTNDVGSGSTSGVVLSVDEDSGNIRLRVTVDSNNWDIKVSRTVL